MPAADVAASARIDAVAKVTGAARYASDGATSDDLHAVLVLADHPRGTLTDISTAAAAGTPGVRAVLTHHDFSRSVGRGEFLYEGGHFHSSFAPMAGPDIRYHGQLIALVVADTVEQARHAATLVTWHVASAQAAVTLDQCAPADDQEIFRHDTGDEHRPDESDTCLDAEYRTAPLLHQPIEPYATRADWGSGRLVVESPSQWVIGEAHGLAQALGVPVDQVQVLSPLIGGAFGSRVLLLWHTVYVADAARRLHRPVRLHVARNQMATLGSFRAETHQRVRLVASGNGKIMSYRHDVRSQTSRSDRLPLPGTSLTSRMYAIPAQRHVETVAPADVATPGFMRAPLEYPVAFALESALDELAIRRGLDPLDLRLKNLHTGPAADTHGTRAIGDCLRTGATRFGWSARNPAVASMRDDRTGEGLGWGVAVAHYPGYRGGLTRARIRVDTGGVVTVSLAAHDPGTGLASAVALAVARTLGVAPGRVEVRLGDSDLPLAPMAAGSASSSTAVSAAVQAATELLEKHGALMDHDSSYPIEAEATYIPEGYRPGQDTQALRGHFVQSGPDTASGFRFSVGAHFVEVGVDARRGRIRVRRMLGVFDIGTVLHSVLARGQLESGMLWGASHALMEDAGLDAGTGRFLAAGLADYHFFSHADAPAIDVVVLDANAVESPSHAKGAGELGVVGSSAAVTNAIYHATGHRVRALPVHAESVLYGERST